MAKFIFRLQRVLEVKEKEEDVKKNEYAEFRKRLEDESQKLELLNSDVNNIKFQKNSLSKGMLKLEQLSSYNNYISSLNEFIDRQSLVVEKSEKELEKARVGLLEATKEKKILENLKLRNLEEYKYGLKQEEDKMTDQFVSYSRSNNALED